jgi:hypothetical protein
MTDKDELSRRIEEMAAASRNRRGYALSSDELTHRIKEIARRGASSEGPPADNEEK